MTKPKRNPESGYALLLIYAMAAIVAITLYSEIPRVAFEAQRDKEQLLIDRGEQYTRAVNLYVRKFNKFPADFDALQNTQNLRFLRRKYIDPMTGKDDWRIIHVGPGGVFTDSLVYGKKKGDKQQGEPQNFISELQQTGGIQVAGNQGVNLATRLRPTDQPGTPGDPNNPSQPSPPPQPGFPQPGLPQQSLPQTGFAQPGLLQFDANGQPIPQTPNGSVAPVPQGTLPGQFPAGTNGFPGQPLPNQQSGQQPFIQPNGPPSTAAGLISQILTTPRPGGLNGFGGVQQPTVDQNGNQIPNANGIGSNAAATSTFSPPVPNAPAAPVAQAIGGGMAGVASKYEQGGIKVYKDRTSYNEWEFVYDVTKDPARGGGTVPQAAPPPNGVPAQNPTAFQNTAPVMSVIPTPTPAPTAMPLTQQ
jgi:hypothetical protein